MEKVCWNLTNRCNEECSFCFRELFETPRSFEDNLIILDNLYKMGVRHITFAGGEPLLYQDLVDLMVRSKELGMKVSLITNGSRLNENNIEDILKYVDRITFSIDSSLPFRNKIIGRGEGHYEHIKSILPYIREKFPDIIIEINSVVFKENIAEIEILYESIVEDFLPYGLQKWKISRFCPLRGKAKEREKQFSVSDQEFNTIKEYFDLDNDFFPISIRDTEDVNSNVIVSPSGNLKVSYANNEETVFYDLSRVTPMEMQKVLKKGDNK